MSCARVSVCVSVGVSVVSGTSDVDEDEEGRRETRRLRWARHVARMGESRNAYRVLVGRPEGKRPLGRPRRRWEDIIKMDLREVEYDDRDWINLAQDRDQWRAYVRAASNVDVIGDSEMVFDEMRPRIRHSLPHIFLTVGKTSEKLNQMIISSGMNPRQGTSLDRQASASAD
ncbi:hypothetical protein ANN_14690 [Periplaneta americana]|uniref:Uncharacterized protein n=1 Tax=Periplaneta americana TaxID=6978 RepID=A0ABQ8SY33_PERAM|nr:hypothetical protein ANN_14690 [Periplaneta americana]